MAARLNNKFLIPASIRRKTDGGYDIDTGETTVSEMVIQCLAIVGTVKKRDMNGVQTTETVATVNKAIQIGDTLSIGQRSYVIHTVDEVAPDGKPIIWKAVVR